MNEKFKTINTRGLIKNKLDMSYLSERIRGDGITRQNYKWGFDFDASV